MRIFITGGSGLLGSRIAEIAGEDEVYSGYCHSKPAFGEPVRFDISSDDRVKAVCGEIAPDVVIHTAAMTDVDACEKNKPLAYDINSEGTRRIADAAKKCGAFLVYVSTDYVFSGDRGMYCEEDKPDPINHYGYTKFLGERHCDCVVRTCVVYGARPASGKVNFALWLKESLGSGVQARVVTDQFVTPTLNTNLAKMVLEVAERELTGVIHLSGRTRVSRFDFALRLAEAFGLDKSLLLPSSMSEMKWAARRPRDSSLDTRKASEILREKPLDLNESLHILKEEIENAEGSED